MIGSKAGMSRTRKMGQVQKVSKEESPGDLARVKLGKQGRGPQGDLSSPSICWSCGLNPLTLHIAGHVAWTLP